MNKILFLNLMLFMFSSCTQKNLENTITILLDSPQKPVSKELYGLFFEDINYGGDGGLYAEMLQNRSFEDALLPARCSLNTNKSLVSPTGWISRWYEETIPGWKVFQEKGAQVKIELDQHNIINPANPASLKLEITNLKNVKAGIYNEGFGGLAVRKGEKYKFMFFAKPGSFNGKVTISLETPDSRVLASQTIDLLSDGWKQYKGEIETSDTATNARFVISTTGNGALWLDFVSLFPEKTFLNRENGLRADLAEMLKNLSPRFLRFPGGCVVEGFSKETMLNWKNTIGPIWERPGQYSLWAYRNTNGLGYLEFLQFCEDLKIEPLFVFNCGMSCQGRNPELIPEKDLHFFIQDALDAIEYANGETNTKWGAVRAKHGHPTPFNLRLVEIGNENWGPEYEKRYKLFYEAIKKEYPQIICISDSWVSSAPLEIVDEHFYPDPYFFMAHHNHYDNFDTTKAKIYVGEYAAILRCGKGNLLAAIGEAAFLLGLERNPDVVKMSSYAPLFKNAYHQQPWNPDAINFDNHRVYGTPSYHMMKMFGANRGDALLVSETKTTLRPYTTPGKIAFNGRDALAEFKEIEVSAKGESLWKIDPQKGLEQFLVQSGKWECQHGVLKQLEKGDEYKQVVLVGDSLWDNYTLTFKVRKITDNDGFVIRFRDNGQQWGNRDFCQITFGAEGGKMVKAEHVLGWCREDIGQAQPFGFNANTWYEVKLILDNEKIFCSIDGIEILTASMLSIPSIVSVTTLDKQNDELIVKIVNTTSVVQPTLIKLNRNKKIKVKPEGIMLTISNGDFNIENSFEQPENIVPVETIIPELSNNSMINIVPNSINVLKIKMGD